MSDRFLAWLSIFLLTFLVNIILIVTVLSGVAVWGQCIILILVDLAIWFIAHLRGIY